MIRFLTLLLLLVTYYLSLTTSIHAADEHFSASYHIIYDVAENADTIVTEQVTLKNLTDKFYPSEFDLSIGATEVLDVFAQDDQGPLEVNTKNEGVKTAVQVKFNQQVSGLGKEYKWKLSYRSQDFAQHIGKIWQISMPKLVSTSDKDNYQVEVWVPVSLGDPATIVPTPQKQTEIGGKIRYFFAKNQLLDSGISANFGTNQIFNFALSYHLQNDGMLPKIASIYLPFDNDYQKISIENINPIPENITIDGEGNYIASFKVDRRQQYDIKVEGLAKITGKSELSPSTLSAEQTSFYTSKQKYWDKDSPQIQTKLSELFKGKNPTTNKEKAKLIHKFVASYLQYDSSRINQGDHNRFGGLTALNNPSKALCSEFTDLFISLARAANIPTRFVAGFGYSQNKALRPLSQRKDILHNWPEYFDPDLGWVMIDPTWENTTGGVDYFSQFDLNHFTLATQAETSFDLWLPEKVEVNLSEKEVLENPNLKFSLDAPQIIYAGFPTKTTLRIENRGTTILEGQKVEVSSEKLTLTPQTQFETPKIPPFGHLEYPFTLKSAILLQSFTDTLSVKVGTESAQLMIPVDSIFTFNYLISIALIVLLAIVSIYIVILVLHLRLQFFEAIFKKSKK